MVCFTTSCAVLLAVIAVLQHAAAVESNCGRPGDHCGSAPGGVVFGCPGNPGFCQPGYYCGKDKRSGDSKCMPVPKDCGKFGGPCCPSNAEKPHTSSTASDDRKPFCRDGSLCYFSVEQIYNTNDPYAGITSECAAVIMRNHCQC